MSILLTVKQFYTSVSSWSVLYISITDDVISVNYGE